MAMLFVVIFNASHVRDGRELVSDAISTPLLTLL